VIERADTAAYDFAKGLPELDSKRVRLRQLGEADVADLFEIFSDPEVTRYWGSGPLSRIDDARTLLEEIEAGRRDQRFFQWGIVLKSDPRVIGTCTLYAWNREHRRAELGFALKPSLWGQGLASEAVDRVVDFGFDELGLHRLEADSDPRNTASIRILMKLGFREEGYLRERYLIGGEAQDAVFMGLLRTEWVRTL